MDRNKLFSLYLLMGFVMCSALSVWAQTNPYRLGTPHYWMAQGTLDIYAGKFEAAYSDLQIAKESYRKMGDTYYQINAIIAMGSLKSNMGEIDLARGHFQEALDLSTEVGDEQYQARSLVEMIAFYKAYGDIKNYNQCVGALDSLYNRTSFPAVKTLFHTFWSKEYTSQQEYKMAEYHLQQCWDAIQELSITDREQAKLSYYSNMLELQKLQKDYRAAVEYGEKYVQQSQLINGSNSDQHMQSYSLLATLYCEQGDSISAFEALNKMRQGVGRTYQDSSWEAAYYDLRGTCYSHFKNYEKAKECFDKAYNLLIDRNTEESPIKYQSLHHKSEALFALKQYDEAYNTYLNCVQVCKNKFGDTSGNYYQTLYTLACIEAERDNHMAANRLFRESMNFLLANMKPLWRYSTPSQREVFWKETLNKLSGMAAFTIKCGALNNELTETCYNALLFSKALLLETEKSLSEILRSEGTKEDVMNYRQLMALNNRILHLKSNYAYNQVEIDTLIMRQRDLEQRLTEKCQSFNAFNSVLDIDYRKVKGQLSNNEILIDFSDYLEEDSLHQYTAYVVSNRQEFPILVKCFEQSQLDSLLNGAANFTLYNYELLENQAAVLIWKPLRKYIAEGSTVYYVPSGVIHGIAIESLPLEDGTLLGQHYNFVRLTSAREIGKRNRAYPTHKIATLYGGLEYNLTPQILEEESKAYDKTDLSWIYRSGYGKAGFKYLSKSKEEVQKIAQTLTDNGYKVNSYSGVKGNAESFIAMSGKSPSILHIATHGFFYTPDEANKYDYLNGYTDAMSLSGLVFSGGNAAWLGKEVPSGVLGGILTARDIANLNLKGTDLVMLSACKTAQGNVTAEGLYGLQRAFKKAGVGTLILTLWKVRDPVAESFATTFYKELMNQRGDKRSAFEITKNIIRKKYKDSFDWACFVMVD